MYNWKVIVIKLLKILSQIFILELGNNLINFINVIKLQILFALIINWLWNNGWIVVLLVDCHLCWRMFWNRFIVFLNGIKMHQLLSILILLRNSQGNLSISLQLRKLMNYSISTISSVLWEISTDLSRVKKVGKTMSDMLSFSLDSMDSLMTKLPMNIFSDMKINF